MPAASPPSATASEARRSVRHSRRPKRNHKDTKNAKNTKPTADGDERDVAATPMILALETGGDLASGALLDGLDVVAERAFRHRMSLSRGLMPAIEALVAAARAVWDDVGARAARR